MLPNEVVSDLTHTTVTAPVTLCAQGQRRQPSMLRAQAGAETQAGTQRGPSLDSLQGSEPPWKRTQLVESSALCAEA